MVDANPFCDATTNSMTKQIMKAQTMMYNDGKDDDGATMMVRIMRRREEDRGGGGRGGKRRWGKRTPSLMQQPTQ